MQTSHSEYRDKYVAGQIVGDDFRLETMIAEDASNIDPGMIVIKGTADKQAKKPTAAFAPATIQGIVINNQRLEKAISTGDRAIQDEETFTVLTRGKIAVPVTDTVARGETAWFVHTVGTSAVHTWRGDIDTNKASKIPGRYLEAGTTGDIVLVEINLDLIPATLT